MGHAKNILQKVIFLKLNNKELEYIWNLLQKLLCLSVPRLLWSDHNKNVYYLIQKNRQSLNI